MLHHLNSSQYAYLSRHRQHWREAALSVRALDPLEIRSRVQAAIAAADSDRKGQSQQVLLAKSPWQALREMPSSLKRSSSLPSFGTSLQRLLKKLMAEIESQLDRHLLEILDAQLITSLQQTVTASLTEPIAAGIAQQWNGTATITSSQIMINNCIEVIAIEQLLPAICLLDYAIDVLGCTIENTKAWWAVCNASPKLDSEPQVH